MLGSAAVILLVLCDVGYAVYVTCRTRDRIAFVVAREATLVPLLADGHDRTLGFDSELAEAGVTGPRGATVPAPSEIIEFPAGGCLAVTLIPSPGVLKLIPATGSLAAESCTLTFRRVSTSGPPPIPRTRTPNDTEPVPIGGPGSATRVVQVLKGTDLKVLRYRKSTAPGEASPARSPSTFPQPTAEAPRTDFVTVEGEGLRLESMAIRWVGDRPILLLDVSAERFTTVRVDTEDRTKCWRGAKFTAALRRFKIPDRLEGALGLVDASCDLGWAGRGR